MRVAVLGTGSVGQALAVGLKRLGHEVRVGTRDPEAEKIVNWLATVEDQQAVTLEDAAQWCEIAFLCTGWSGTENAITLCKTENLREKIVVDVTNPLAHSDSGMHLDVDAIKSAGEQVQRWLPESHVVKSLNVLNANFMLDAQIDDGQPLMFVAGNNGDAKKAVATLLESAGWSVFDLGGIAESRLMEALAMIWIKYAIANQKFDMAWQPVTLRQGARSA